MRLIVRPDVAWLGNVLARIPQDLAGAAHGAALAGNNVDKKANPGFNVIHVHVLPKSSFNSFTGLPILKPDEHPTHGPRQEYSVRLLELHQ